VTCLRVEGNRASIGVEFNRNRFGMPLSPRAALIVVEDNGPVEADRFAVHDLPAGHGTDRLPVACGRRARSGVRLLAGVDLRGCRGHRRPAAGADADVQGACRHGGWRAFGFRNQGQCIAFVERGPKPPKP
jgi:hypothetical protein